MFQKILVAMDSSTAAQAVFARAVALAQATEAHLMLLHVLSADDDNSPGRPMYPLDDEDSSEKPLPSQIPFFPPYDDPNLEAYRKRWDEFEKEGLERLQRYTEQATDKGIKAEFTQIPGHPGQTIGKMAQTWGSDLIVMGSRGRKGLQELFLGSVSNYVMHHAPCSVLIVHS